ncbi:MAG: hypothetical protein R3F19_18665 [Verrucomicrobiales bacterium]
MLYWEYRYDDLGQVISAKKYWRDGKPVAGQQFEYAFDGIGNRETAKYGGDTRGENLSEITYTKGTADSTQIGSIEHPGITYVTGKANEGAEVEVTAASAATQPEIDRQGEHFSAPVTIDNTNGASVEKIDIAAREGSQSDTTTRRAFIPARETQYLYDPDGNLLYDGRWRYEWDAENRLVAMRTANESVRGSRSMELQFAYDHIGRRISKRVIETIEGEACSRQRSAFRLRWLEPGRRTRHHRAHLPLVPMGLRHQRHASGSRRRRWIGLGGCAGCPRDCCGRWSGN